LFLLVAYRIEILDCHKLKPDHFASMEEACNAADVMVSGLKANWPLMAEEHPDILIPGVPMLDQFWYFKHEGTMASPRIPHTHIKLHIHVYIYIWPCLFGLP
jgi:hypothetical protein